MKLLRVTSLKSDNYIMFIICGVGLSSLLHFDDFEDPLMDLRTILTIAFEKYRFMMRRTASEQSFGLTHQINNVGKY